ncbi:MAG: Uma2 family endonuclease [Tepidiformaceae bacterium]
MTTAERLITVEEFYALPDPPQGGKMELVDGRVVTMSPVGRKHAYSQAGLIARSAASPMNMPLAKLG